MQLLNEMTNTRTNATHSQYLKLCLESKRASVLTWARVLRRAQRRRLKHAFNRFRSNALPIAELRNKKLALRYLPGPESPSQVPVEALPYVQAVYDLMGTKLGLTETKSKKAPRKVATSAKSAKGQGAALVHFQPSVVVARAKALLVHVQAGDRAKGDMKDGVKRPAANQTNSLLERQGVDAAGADDGSGSGGGGGGGGDGGDGRSTSPAPAKQQRFDPSVASPPPRQGKLVRRKARPPTPSKRAATTSPARADPDDEESEAECALQPQTQPVPLFSPVARKSARAIVMTTPSARSKWSDSDDASAALGAPVTSAPLPPTATSTSTSTSAAVDATEPDPEAPGTSDSAHEASSSSLNLESTPPRASAAKYDKMRRPQPQRQQNDQPFNAIDVVDSPDSSSAGGGSTSMAGATSTSNDADKTPPWSRTTRALRMPSPTSKSYAYGVDGKFVRLARYSRPPPRNECCQRTCMSFR